MQAHPTATGQYEPMHPTSTWIFSPASLCCCISQSIGTPKNERVPKLIQNEPTLTSEMEYRSTRWADAEQYYTGFYARNSAKARAV